MIELEVGTGSSVPELGGITPKSLKQSKSTPKQKTDTKTPTSYYDEQTESE